MSFVIMLIGIIGFRLFFWKIVEIGTGGKASDGDKEKGANCIDCRFTPSFWVEYSGLEPLTSTLPVSRSSQMS